MLLRGGKKSSQFLSSCNEDNLIKIKAKLIKDLKVQVFGCIISLKHGRTGLLSSREVPGHADRWCSHQAIRMTNIQLNYIFFWPLLLAFLLLIFLLFYFWKNWYFGRQFPLFPRSFVWVRSWRQTSWALTYSWFSWFFPWSCCSQIEKENMFTHTSPYSMCIFSCPFTSLKKERRLKIPKVFVSLEPQ